MPHGRAHGWWTALAATWLAAAAAAAELRPSWECLPATTAAMVRLPCGAEAIEALRDSTRFGAVILRQDRLEGIWRLLVEQAEQADGGSFTEWEESLAKYGLERDDLAAAFAGDVGAGLVVQPREGLPPLTMLLAWAEPGADVADRLLAAVKQRLEEVVGEDDGPAPHRLDLDLAGHEVVSAVVPVMGIDMKDVDLEELMAEDGADGEGGDRLEKLRARLRDAKRIQTGQTHTFHAVLGSRFLYGTTFPIAAAGEDGAEADLDRVSGGDEAAEVFGGFLAAHAAADEPALAAAVREPALAAATPAGLLMVEAIAVPRRLVEAAGGDDPETAERLAELGLDDVGAVAWRQTLDGGRWRSTVAATLPAPRHGLLKMLDQPCDASDMPPFVTREAVSFTQISLDLGRAFTAVREALLAAAGPEQSEQLANLFGVADVQATTWLGTDVASVLSGLGSRHWVLAFPSRIGAAVAEARAARAAGAVDLPGADSLAVVWQVADEEPFLKLLGRLAPLAGGQLEEEQGFRGLRIPGGAAAFVGRNHLVVAVGENTLEKLLAAIRNPPAGDVSWRESEAARRARELIEMPPARMIGLSDATKTGGFLGTLRELLAALEADDVEEGSRDLLAEAQKLLPSAADMEGMFGIGASVLRMTDDGLVLEAAGEMSPP